MNGDTPQPPAEKQPDSNWQYKPETKPLPPATPVQVATPAPPPQADPNVPNEISWSASEFIAHQKSLRWYGALGLGAVIIAALTYLITRDKITTGVVIFIALIFGFAASRKPRVMEYRVNASGLQVGPKFFPYSELKSFSIMEEGAFSNIMFTPLKRFMPPIVIYYEPQDEESIATVLARYLPMEHREQGVIDTITTRIRF